MNFKLFFGASFSVLVEGTLNYFAAKGRSNHIYCQLIVILQVLTLEYQDKKCNKKFYFQFKLSSVSFFCFLEFCAMLKN